MLLPALLWRSPVDSALRSVIMAVEVRSARAPEVGASVLESHGAVVRSFGAPVNTLRVSPNVMTEDEELDRFLDAAAAGAG